MTSLLPSREKPQYRFHWNVNIDFCGNHSRWETRWRIYDGLWFNKSPFVRVYVRFLISTCKWGRISRHVTTHSSLCWIDFGFTQDVLACRMAICMPYRLPFRWCSHTNGIFGKRFEWSICISNLITNYSTQLINKYRHMNEYMQAKSVLLANQRYEFDRRRQGHCEIFDTMLCVSRTSRIFRTRELVMCGLAYTLDPT